MSYSTIYRFPDPDPHMRATLEAELARGSRNPELQALLCRKSPDLWARFARYYDHLTRLPRRVRRSLQREWKRSLSGVALLLALGQAPALAATITVGGGCTLVDAITAANTDAATVGCPAGSGADVIVLTGDVTLTAVNNFTLEGPNGLPSVTSTITLSGGNHTVQRSTVTGTPEFRLLHVADTGDLTLNQITLSNGRAPLVGYNSYGRDGYGGGVFNRGTVVVNDSTISGSSAVSYGGGVFNEGTLTVKNSTVSGNTSNGNGGGVANQGPLIVTNSIVTDNTATSEGGDGNDRVNGQAGDDELRGGEGDDVLKGREGSDRLNGGAGSDALLGGADPDDLTGGPGADTLNGGDGTDVCFSDAEDESVVHCE